MARVLKALEGLAGGHPDFAMLHAHLVNLQESDMAVVAFGLGYPPAGDGASRNLYEGRG